MIIAIEGLDGCGKETQSKAVSKLMGQKSPTEMISFPRYESPGCAPVQMYLNGDFGKNADTINPYQASSLFAVDRVTTYLTKIKPLVSTTNFVFDRYVESNLIYQSSKIENTEDRQKFIDWILDYEYGKLCLPKPTKVFFLNVPEAIYEKNILSRTNGNKHSGSDIHESNLPFLRRARLVGLDIAHALNWSIIDCTDGKRMLPPKEITTKIMEQIVS